MSHLLAVLPDFPHIFLGVVKKLRIETVSFMSVRPHGTTRLSLDGFSSNLIFKYFWKICNEN